MWKIYNCRTKTIIALLSRRDLPDTSCTVCSPCTPTRSWWRSWSSRGRGQHRWGGKRSCTSNSAVTSPAGIEVQLSITRKLIKLKIVAKDYFISPNNSPVLLCCGSCCPGTSCRWHWAWSRQPSSSGPSSPSSSPPSPSLASASLPCVVGPWQIRIGEEWCLEIFPFRPCQTQYFNIYTFFTVEK